jgi:plastocyanin
VAHQGRAMTDTYRYYCMPREGSDMLGRVVVEFAV